MIHSKCVACLALLVVAARASAQLPGGRGSCAASTPSLPGAAAPPHTATGADVAIVDSATMASGGGRTVSELLTARLPGVSVMRSSGVVGTGSRIRLRGPSGIVAPQEPLVFLDGMRVDGDAHSISLDAGGQAPSRIDDIPVEDVKCIFVFRGPATTAAYGTDASGGVIHIVTRAAGDDSTRFRAFAESGVTTDAGDYPANYGTGPTGGSCARWIAASGQCVAAPMVSFSPLEANSPFRTAPLIRVGAGANVRATRTLSLGVRGTGLHVGGALRENTDTRFAARVTSAYRPSTPIDIRGDVYIIGGRSWLPQVGAFSYSILNSALLGSAVDDPRFRGYRRAPLDILEQFGTEQRATRLGGMARLTWTPNAWLTVGALVGREDSHSDDDQRDPLIVPGTGGSEFAPNRFVVEGALRNQRTTAAASATATYGPAPFRFSTSGVVEHLAETRRRTTRTFDRADNDAELSYTWSGTEAATTGVVLRQTIASSDRRFLNAGVRLDALDRELIDLENSAYPFANASWDVGREIGLPTNGLLSSLRLRAAYGESGDTRSFARLLDRLIVLTGKQEVERTQELEGGVDISLFGAVSVDATYFDRRTRNGLIERSNPPGTGGSFVDGESSAAWRTRGWELLAIARLLDRRTLGAAVTVAYTSLDNEVTTLGTAPPIVGNGYRIEPGYPLYALWAVPFTVSDANADGVIAPGEVILSGGYRVLGSPVPTRELGVSPTITLGTSVTVTTLIDHRGGFRIDNSGGRLHCTTRCSALYDPEASVFEQARAVDPNDARASWIEDGTFTRLRELSIAWRLPSPWARRLGARSATLTAVGRNLWTGTDYSGLDPETSFAGQSATVQTDLFTLPLARSLSVRFDALW